MDYEQVLNLIKKDGVYSEEVIQVLEHQKIVDDLKKCIHNTEEYKMKDELKSRAIGFVKEIYHMGYDDGCKAAKVFLEEDYEEKIDNIKSEIQNIETGTGEIIITPTGFGRDGESVKNIVLQIIERYCEGDTE